MAGEGKKRENLGGPAEGGLGKGGLGWGPEGGALKDGPEGWCPELCSLPGFGVQVFSSWSSGLQGLLREIWPKH